MGTITDQELVVKVQKKKDNESLQELINRHTPLYFDICKKYESAIVSSGVYLEDVHQESKSEIYKAALSYNPEKKTKYSTWLGNCVRYKCLNLINRSPEVPTDDLTLNYITYQKTLGDNDKETVKDNLTLAKAALDEIKDIRIKKLFVLRYFSGGNKKLTFDQISKKMKTSVQTLVKLHEQGKIFLRKRLKNKEWSDNV
jgi:RNA polymerase sigma factor (sigma-70 family)